MVKMARKTKKKTEVIAIRVSDEEKKKALNTAVKAGFDDVSTWIRFLMRREYNSK